MIPADSGDALTETMLLDLWLCFCHCWRLSHVPADCVFDLESQTLSAPLLCTSVLYYHQTQLICSPAVWFQVLFGLLTLMETCLVAWCSYMMWDHNLGGHEWAGGWSAAACSKQLHNNAQIQVRSNPHQPRHTAVYHVVPTITEIENSSTYAIGSNPASDLLSLKI